MPCPNIEFCPAKVDYKHYTEYCLSDDNWKSCKYYVRYEMTPSQWKKYVGEIPTKSESSGFRLL